MLALSFVIGNYEGATVAVKQMMLRSVALIAYATVCAGISTVADARELYRQGIERKAPRTVKLAARSDQSVSTDERQIIASVKAIVIVSNPKDVKAGGTKATGVDVRGENVPDGVALAAEPYVGAAASAASLDRLTRDMVLAYRAAGIPVVNIVVPPQDVTNGVVQVIAVVGKLGKTSVEGNPSDPDYYLEGFGLEAGDVITQSAVLDHLYWKSRRSYRRLDAIYEPGKNFGETDIAFDVKETKPWSIFAGLDNTGSGGTGDLRIYSGFALGDLWNLDHEFTYQFTTSEKGLKNLAAHAASYTLPVLSRTDFQLSGSYAKTSADSGPGTSKGKSWGLGGMFITQLPGFSNTTWDARYGFEYKNSDNSFEFGGAAASGNTTEVGQFFAQIVGQHAGAKSSTSFDVGVWAAPGGLFSNNDNAAFDASRADAKASYAYLRTNVDHTVFLPKDFLFNVEVEGQLASDRLNPSEMMFLGGLNSVRGFDENAVRGDMGVMTRLELYTPAVALFDRGGKSDALRAFGFFDAGFVDVLSPSSVGESSASLMGAGLGLTYQYNQSVSAEVAYGWKVNSDDQVADRKNGELHFRLMARF